MINKTYYMPQATLLLAAISLSISVLANDSDAHNSDFVLDSALNFYLQNIDQRLQKNGITNKPKANNQAFIQQAGQHQHSEIIQQGQLQKAISVQQGSHNISNINQTGTSNWAYSSQSEAEFNFINIHQQGFGNQAAVIQTCGHFDCAIARNNSAHVKQTGSMHKALVKQAGSFNEAELIQQSHHTNAIIKQYGDGMKTKVQTGL